MKNVWAILLSSLMVLTLTACGNSGSGTQTPTQGTEGGSSTPCTAEGESRLTALTSI